MRTCVYQMDVVGAKPKENRAKVKAWVERVVAEEKPDTILLPEMWTTAYALPELDELADVDGEPTTSFLQDLASEYRINIVGGSFANKVEGKTYNTAVVVDRAGNLVHEYNKIHLVPMLDEHLYLSQGEESNLVFELEGSKMALIICYDLRFPELTRYLNLLGTQVLFIPAEWPSADLVQEAVALSAERTCADVPEKSALSWSPEMVIRTLIWIGPDPNPSSSMWSMKQ